MSSSHKEKFSPIKESPHKLSYEMIFSNSLANPDGEYDPDEKILRSDLKKVLDNKEHEYDVSLNLEKIKTHEQSFIRGLQEGEEIAKERFKEQIAPLQNALVEANSKVDSMMDQLKPYLASLVFDLAEKVVDHPIHSPELQERTQKEISNILTEIDAGIKIKIEVSSFDFELIKQVVDGQVDHQKIDVRVDNHLKPGEFRVDTTSELIVKEFKKILKDFKERIAITNVEKSEEDE